MSSMSGRGPSGNIAGYKQGRMQNFTPEQMQLFQQMFSQVGPDSYLSRLAGGDQSMFAEMEAPALKQFSGMQGNLASRFSGMGQGARRSSGFQNTANAAASDFAGQLQGNRMNLQQQAIKDLMSLSSDLLGQKPYENFLYEKKKPWWQNALAGGLPIAGMLAGGALGGPWGAQIGASAGGAASRAFR